MGACAGRSALLPWAELRDRELLVTGLLTPACAALQRLVLEAPAGAPTRLHAEALDALVQCAACLVRDARLYAYAKTGLDECWPVLAAALDAAAGWYQASHALYAAALRACRTVSEAVKQGNTDLADAWLLQCVPGLASQPVSSSMLQRTLANIAAPAETDHAECSPAGLF